MSLPYSDVVEGFLDEMSKLSAAATKPEDGKDHIKRLVRNALLTGTGAGLGLYAARGLDMAIADKIRPAWQALPQTQKLVIVGALIGATGLAGGVVGSKLREAEGRKIGSGGKKK